MNEQTSWLYNALFIYKYTLRWLYLLNKEYLTQTVLIGRNRGVVSEYLARTNPTYKGRKIKVYVFCIQIILWIRLYSKKNWIKRFFYVRLKGDSMPRVHSTVAVQIVLRSKDLLLVIYTYVLTKVNTHDFYDFCTWSDLVYWLFKRLLTNVWASRNTFVFSVSGIKFFVLLHTYISIVFVEM